MAQTSPAGGGIWNLNQQMELTLSFPLNSNNNKSNFTTYDHLHLRLEDRNKIQNFQHKVWCIKGIKSSK